MRKWNGSRREMHKKKRVHGFTGITTKLRTPMKEHAERFEPREEQREGTKSCLVGYCVYKKRLIIYKLK